MSKILDNRYKLIKVLGKGGFGRTFLARDQRRPGSPLCVVKQLKPASTDPEFIREARRLFNTEAETLERLGNHDQIPQLLAYFEEDNEFFLVQEFIEGTPLNKELETPLSSNSEEVTAADITAASQTKTTGKQMSEGEVIKLLRDILSVLEFVHSENVIHRDIKPDNLIRRQKDNKFVLIDFGAVKAMTDQNVKIETVEGESRFTVTIGTPGYMPSEQCAGRPNYTSDIYAAGMVAIKALTGIDPPDLPTDPETGEIIWRDQRKVSNGLAMVLTRMTRYRFSDRYQSVKEVQQALNAYLVAPENKPIIGAKSKPASQKSQKITVAQVQSGAGAGLLIIGLLCVIGSILLAILLKPKDVQQVIINDNTPAPSTASPKPNKPVKAVEPTIVNNTVNLVDDQETKLAGTIKKDQIIRYTFTAKAQQQFKANLTGEGANFDVLSPNNSTLASGVSSYANLLNDEGEYVLQIKTTGEQVDYNLTLFLSAPPAEVNRIIQVR